MAECRITRIYVLRDPRDGAVRYVGKTCGSLKQRLACHVSDARHGDDRRSRWIRLIVKLGFKPIIEQIDVAGSDWGAVEREWIARFRESIGDRLTNHADGGSGAPGVKRSPESIAKSAQGLSRSWTDERRKRAAKILADRNRTMEHKPWSEERRAKHSEMMRRRWTTEAKAENGRRTAEQNRSMKVVWTDDRRAKQSTVAKRLNAIRWAEPVEFLQQALGGTSAAC